MRISHLPVNDSHSGWSKILPPRAPKPSLAGAVNADWAVVGAGFAGLAAARRLGENRPNESIAVLEAGEAGENASGRNSGFGIDFPHAVGSGQDNLASAEAYMRLSRAAIDHLEAVVSKHRIACDWSRAGKYHAAVSARGTEEALTPYIAMLNAIGHQHRILDRQQTAGELGTAYFRASVFTPGCVRLSKSNAPGFGKVDDNVCSAVCQNAVGVTGGTISGLLAADLACRVDYPLIADMESLGTPAKLPPRPILDIGVRARNAWDGWRGSYEY